MLKKNKYGYHWDRKSDYSSVDLKNIAVSFSSPIDAKYFKPMKFKYPEQNFFVIKLDDNKNDY